MNRRDYLAAGAGVGAAALSGCSFLAAAERPPPEVPQQRLDEGGWAQTNESSGTVLERDYGPVTLEAVSHTLQYVDQALQTRVADWTLGQVEAALSVFFATRVDFSPNLDNLPAGVGQGEIVDQVKANSRDQFEGQMRDQGLTDIEKTGEGRVAVDTGETAETVEMAAVFPFEGIEFPVTDEAGVAIPSADIEVSALLAVWHHGDFVLVSGGAYPAESFATSVEDDLSEGITVSVDVDLDLTPSAYREEMRGLVAGVQ
ncbi:DUF6517 family protein [Halomicroarcula sp. GCM10025324]|uniref:DUF6517 family protein n=1 Tax=Haloarcula TaxID=2237 RepID=UPI0023E7F5BC|nr:DUF6517 family protein [Halomicroarcula sp. ZS-22-S1]